MVECNKIAKSLKAFMTSIHYKRRRMSSGTKTSPELVRLLNECNLLDAEDEEPQLPLAACSSKTVQSSCSRAQPSSTSTCIAHMYGFAKTTAEESAMLSQMTISSDGDHCIPDSSASQDHGDVVFFDHAACCLVRRLDNGETVMSEMRPGSDGFAEAVFPDGKILTTEIVNLELFGLKEPVLKKPAASSAVLQGIVEDPLASATGKSESDDAEASQTGQGDQTSEPEKAAMTGLKAHKHYKFPDGVEMKLGQFTAQSYITTKPPGAVKYTLLVACSDKQAARNGLFHHNVMKKIWDDLQDMPTLPDKASCKRKLLSILEGSQ